MTDDDTFGAIHEIKTELAAQGGILRTLLYAQGSHLADEMIKELLADDVLSQVFLLVNGTRTQTDIIDALRAARMVGASQSSISRKMIRLHDLGLISPVGKSRGAVLFGTTPVADAFKIRQALERAGRRIVTPSQDGGSGL